MNRLAILVVLLLGSFTLSSARAAESLHIFTWSEYLDPTVVKEFETRFSAKVTLDYYEDAESMVAKLQAGGADLYDIVVPSDHLVKPMVQLRLLAPLRPQNLPNLRNLDPKFARPAYDPRLEYTVPFQWGTMGLYLRKEAGKPVPDSWAAIFDPAKAYGPYVLIDSVRDLVGVALKYRGHSFNTVETPALKEARDLLLAAKSRSVAFEGSVGGKNRVLAKSAKLAICYSGDAVRGMKEDADTTYVLPREGSEIWVDTLAIPARAPHRDLAEKFINFVLEPAIGARVAQFNFSGTPNAAARALTPPEYLQDPAIYPPADQLPRLEALEDLGSKNRLFDQIWAQVKAQ